LVQIDPWMTEDVYYHGTPSTYWTGMGIVDTLMSETYGAVDNDAWCHDFSSETSTNYIWRFVSQVGVDGVSTVDDTDCNDWVSMDAADFCDTYYDKYCRTYAASDGCNMVGPVIGLTWDETELIPL